MLKPKQSLGQNFLQDPNTIRNIVAAVEAPEGCAVVEIGPGTGALTAELMKTYPDFCCIEIDGRAVDLLNEKFPSLKVIKADVLKMDWVALSEELGKPLVIVGNLPYYITSQILFSIFAAKSVVKRAVVMMQLEVADRLIAVPRTKAYGILAVQTQLISTPKKLLKIPPSVFYPKPDVWSAVIGLDFKDTEAFPPNLTDVIRTAFNQRRKTLRNALSKFGELPPEIATKRAEELSPTDFVSLAQILPTTENSVKI